MRNARVLTCVAVVCWSLPGVAQDTRPSATGAPRLADKVVAKVNRTVITQSDVDRDLGPNAKDLTPGDLAQERQRAEFRLVIEVVQRDAVQQVGINIPKRYVEERLEKEKEEFAKKGDSFSEYLSGAAKSEEEYRDDLQGDLTRQIYVQAAAGSFRAQQFRPDYWPEPTVEDLRSYYRRRVGEEFTYTDRARVFAIALPFSQYPSTEQGATPDSRARQIAEQIRDSLATGGDFATLARRYSRSAEFKPESGGDLGWVERKSAYNPLIVNYAFDGPVRELSQPILYPRAENARSLLLLWVDERVERKVASFEEVQDDIRNKLRSERLRYAQGRIQAKLLQEAYIWPPELKQKLLLIALK
jgi:hypothetical protein